MKEAFNCASAVPPQGPYSHGNKAAGLCFASGQMPADPMTGVIPEGITEQTRQVLKNIEAILRDGGCSLADVVKMTVYLKDMEDFAAMNAVYASYYTENCPARSAVEVGRLPKDVLVEVETIAYI